MLFSEMVQEVKNIVQDSSFDASIEGYVNEAFLQASGRVNIPDLKRVGIATTVTEQMYTPLAGVQDGFSGRLSKIISKDILRFSSIEDLVSWILEQDRLLTEYGTVEAVALEGRTLWYFPTPKIETDIQCIMFSNPVVMYDNDDIPLAFPEICHRNIGVHGAAMFAYGIIEDGVEGIKVQTEYHSKMFDAGITQLVEWVGRHRVHMTVSCLNEDVATQSWGAAYKGFNNVR